MSQTSKLEYLTKKLNDLASSPAWSGQVTPFINDGKVEIQVRNRFVRDWLKENYLPQIRKEVANLPGDELTLQIVVVSPADSADSSTRDSATTEGELSLTWKAQEKSEPSKNLLHESLRPKYSFESFVVGSSNQFAHAAARAVTKFPAKNYNPLFVYGGVGLGKTHLLNAIGIEFLKSHPSPHIIYMSSEKFMNELIHSIRFEKMGDFRRKYRHCDLLLIDDIQFIAGKERTQEEFFHTFNHLHDSQRQIVLTSDKPPRDIPGLEERLRSRFEWGLIADIQPPDLETRIAILKRKAEEDALKIDDDVALFLATHIKSNVRELEGALIRLNAFASLGGGVSMTVSLAKDVLRNVLSNVDRVLTIEHVQKVVADYYRIKLTELTGKRRVKSLAFPRQVAMYLCRKHVKSSYPELGTKFGGKDHSTVVHAFGKIQRVLATDEKLQEQIEVLEQTLSR